MVVIKMKDYGNAFVTHNEGIKLYDEIYPLIEHDDVVFDFEDVDSFTNSFAMELFGKLSVTHDMDCITYKNLKPFLYSVLNNAIKTYQEAIGFYG